MIKFFDRFFFCIFMIRRGKGGGCLKKRLLFSHIIDQHKQHMVFLNVVNRHPNIQKYYSQH